MCLLLQAISYIVVFVMLCISIFLWTFFLMNYISDMFDQNYIWILSFQGITRVARTDSVNVVV